MSDWATFFGYEKIEWEDLIWHWLIHDNIDRFDFREWGVILDGLLQKLSETVDLPLCINEAIYDIEGESQNVDFEVHYHTYKTLQPNIDAQCHVGAIETDGQRRFEGFAEFSFVFKNIKLVGENGETCYRYEIERTDNGKTSWKPVGWMKSTTSEGKQE